MKSLQVKSSQTKIFRVFPKVILFLLSISLYFMAVSGFSQTSNPAEIENALLPASETDKMILENTISQLNALNTAGLKYSAYCENPESPLINLGPALISGVCDFTGGQFDIILGAAGGGISTLNSDMVIEGLKIWLRTSLLVKGNIVFRNCEIKVDPGKVIIVDNGKTLRLENSELTTCEGMWFGVGAIENGTNIDIVSSGSQIIGAIAGLFSFNPFSVDFSVVGTTFDRNFMGLVLDTDILGSPGATVSQFKSNIFDCSSPLPGTTDGRSRAGVLLSGQVLSNATGNTYRNLEFGVLAEKGNTFYSESFSTFNDLAQDGIFLKKGSVDLNWVQVTNYGRNGLGFTEAFEVDLNNCTFRLEEDFIPFQPLNPQSNTSPICGIGIENFAVNARLNIRSSGFFAENKEDDLYISGILLGGGGGSIGANTQIFILDNNWHYVTGKESSCIELNGEFPASTNTDIFQNEFLYDPFRTNQGGDANAIWCRNGDKNNLKIYSNTFVGDESNDFAGNFATVHRGHGIKLSGSNGENNEVSDNDFPVNYFAIYNDDYSLGISTREFHNVRLCNNFLGNPRLPIWLQLADMTTEVLANTIVTSNKHFTISSCALGPQNHTGQEYLFKYAFGGPGSHASCIPENSSGMNVINVHTEQSVEATTGGFLFFSEYYPSRVSPQASWFFTTSGNPIEDCLTEFNIGNDQTDFYKEIINNTWESTVDNPAFYRSLQTTVFRLIDKDPQAFAGETELMNFYSTNQNSAIGQTLQIRNKAKSCYLVEEGDIVILDGIASQVSSLKADLDLIDQAINTTSDSLTLASLITQKINLLSDWQTLESQRKVEVNILESQKIQQGEEGLLLVQGFPAIAPYELYFKEVYTIYFERIIQGGILTESQIADLITIGTACPIAFGNIVDMARGMIPLCRRPDFDDTGCIPEIEETEESLEEYPLEPRRAKNDKRIRVYPNPNAGICIIENIPIGADILVADIYGKIIRRESLIPHSAISLKGLSRGIYILNIRTSEGETYSRKIIVSN